MGKAGRVGCRGQQGMPDVGASGLLHDNPPVGGKAARACKAHLLHGPREAKNLRQQLASFPSEGAKRSLTASPLLGKYLKSQTRLTQTLPPSIV